MNVTFDASANLIAVIESFRERERERKGEGKGSILRGEYRSIDTFGDPSFGAAALRGRCEREATNRERERRYLSLITGDSAFI